MSNETHQETRRRYPEATKIAALQHRIGGRSYQDISNELDIPEATLKKWFAPSTNRYKLASLEENHLQELREISSRILQADIVSVTQKLTDMALKGNMRAIIEVMNHVHGVPIKQPIDEPDEPESSSATEQLAEHFQRILELK